LVLPWHVPAADARYYNMKLKVVFESEKIRDAYMLGEKKFVWTYGNSGIDLRSAEESFELQPGERKIVSSGIRTQLDENNDLWEVQLRPRSGMNAKGIYVALGTIDYSYTGVMGVVMTNQTSAPFKIEFGDRIAQFVVCPIAKPEIEIVEKFEERDRGSKAFGSSGVK